MAGCSGHDVQTWVSIRDRFIGQQNRILKPPVRFISIKSLDKKENKITEGYLLVSEAAC
jgi:hypothetical protein